MKYQKYSLKNFHLATKQEISDQICEHLMIQQQKSVTVSPQRCVYRLDSSDSDHIIKCAAGCLISDTEYSIDMENENFVSLLQSLNINEACDEFFRAKTNDIKFKPLHDLILLISKFQKIHDLYPDKIYFIDRIWNGKKLDHTNWLDNSVQVVFSNMYPDFNFEKKDNLTYQYDSWYDALKPFVLSEQLEWRFD